MTHQTSPTEPFRFTDADGDYLHIGIPNSPTTGHPALSFHTMAEPVHVPVEEVEGLITALRRLVAAQAAAPAVVEPPAGQTGEVRDQLLHAIDFNYVASVGYTSPEELLAAYDTSRTQPADRAALHRIAEAALAAVETALGDTLASDAREEALSGIAAVLPEPADRATAPVCICGHPEERHFEDVCQTCGCGDYLEPRDAAEVIDRWRQAALKAPADRAAVLREAAQHLYTALFPAVYNDLGQKAAEGVNRAVSELRRMADETATTETPFTPPAHYRRDDGVECCVHAIPVGPGSCPACRELADDEPAAGPTIVDQVVAALQAKAQVLSLEAEEEMRRDLEEQAQVWHEAADLARRTGRKVARSAQPAAGARQDGAQP